MMLGNHLSEQLTRAAALAMLLSLVSPGSCQNIDTVQPILRSVPTSQDDLAFFGYTLALHQTENNPPTMAAAVSGARIIVSAPNGTTPSGILPNTGLVYSCPVGAGQCSGLGGKLSDRADNQGAEDKTNQFLGSSMASNGDRFIVCAHRYKRLFFNRVVPVPLGKCFFSERNLGSFTEYQPCNPNSNQLIPASFGVCQVGTSATIVPDGNGFAYGVGAPGVNLWSGAVYRRNAGGGTSQQSTGTSTDSFAYQGYAITGGRFLSSSRQDFAVSLPRRNLYFGSVNLVMNSNRLQFTSQPLMGMQMGEYYGFSLLAADLDGDGFDELLVSAPLFRADSTEPETGRVFLYRNNGGTLALERTIAGRSRFSRFGYAMANLGDISGDGFDDVAISAPFTETGNTEPGTVFIYHSAGRTLLLTTEPQQIIRGTDLSLTQGLSGLRGFGTSLASGVDVDNNSYNDLLVGSFLSQQAFLLRTRPLAQVSTSVTASPQIVDVMDRSNARCMLNGTAYACFDVNACATYSGNGLNNRLSLTFVAEADTQNVERRIIFANGGTTQSRSVEASINAQTCQAFTAYIRNDMLNDVFNPFIMEVRINTVPQDITTGNGNLPPQDLSSSPVVSQSGATLVQVETLKECNGGVCIPDLRVSVLERRIIASDRGRTQLNSIVAGFTSTVEYIVRVNNPREDAFQATLSFVLPSNTLDLVNVFNQTSNGEVSIRCDLPEALTNEQNEPLNMLRHNCSIGNPFSGPGEIRLRVQLSPRSTIVGNEGPVSVTFSVSSINPEEQATIDDNSNSAVAELTIEARADISIDDGVVTPAQLSYSDNTRLSDQGVTLANVSQLGPAVDVSFLVRNSGPSRVPSIDLQIMWPLRSSLTGDNFYLYITSIQSSGGASVTCNSEYINQLNLVGDVGDQEGGDSTVGMGTGRRKRREAIKRTLTKRQAAPVVDQQTAQNITLDCGSGNPILTCVPITCTLLGLSGSASTQIDINARLDERFFSTSSDRFVFIPTASVSITQGNVVIQPNNPNQEDSERMANAQIRVIPAARVSTVGEATPVPWWAILVPILAAVIVITVIAVLLWVFGFFRRKKHEEIKQRREELQNLQDNGISPADKVDI